MVKGNEDMRQMARLFFQQQYTEDVHKRPNLDNLHFRMLCVKSRDGLEARSPNRKLNVS